MENKMNKKISLLPRMAVNNIRKNGSTYFPYIGVSIFAMFTYFSFDLILKNDIMKTLPKAGYATMLVSVGFLLLGLILIPFLYYTNSFLIKRRKKELGLYSILGMEKKHIGVMMLWESLIVYCLVLVAAVVLGLVFSKLIFMLLLNLAKIPVSVGFSLSPQAILDSVIFYAVVTGLNLLVNLVQVGKARPVELMSDSRKGEKEPKAVWLWTLLGVICMGLGYYLSVTSSLNSMIFSDFFFAVFLVVGGTYFLFTSGSVALLRRLKRRKRFYYRADNFITVSGMLYRMKKNAASLSNICVFGTMVLITVICTVSMGFCSGIITENDYPRTHAFFFGEPEDEENMGELLGQAAEKSGVELTKYMGQTYQRVQGYLDGDEFRLAQGDERYDYANRYNVELMTIAEFNSMEETDRTLEAGETLIFTSGVDFGHQTLSIGEHRWTVKEELQGSRRCRKSRSTTYDGKCVIVFASDAERSEAAVVFGEKAEPVAFWMACTPVGGDEEINQFVAEADRAFDSIDGYAGSRDYREDIGDREAMFGGLIFIGIFFGAVFLICLLIVMYYKQITEGFEDRKNFEIMQKVGMDDEEIRKTIKKQILLVFALPLAGAVLHTIVGMKMVIVLMAAFGNTEVQLMWICTAVSCVVFALFYSLCYKRTSATYYRIVR